MLPAIQSTRTDRTMKRSVIRTPLRLKLLLTAAVLLAFTPALHAQSVEERLDRIERLLESRTLLDIARQNEQLRSEVQRLTGELQVTQRQLEELQRQQRSLYADMDDRLQQLEQGRGGAGSTDTADAPGDAQQPVVPDTPGLDADLASAGSGTSGELPGDIPVPDEPVSNPEAEDAYREAFGLLREGRYDTAGDAFRQVLEDYPDTRQADNARYWLGESYYVVRDFDAAMEHFQAVMDDTDNNKQPDAMLKVGFIQYERGDYSDARETLERVRNDFPDSTVATLAQNRLERMREENR